MTDLRTAAQQALDYIIATNRSSSFRLVPDSNLNKTITDLRAALAEFNPDWDRIEPLQENLREHMAEIQRLRAQRDALLEALQTVEWHGAGSCWVVDADKIAAAIKAAEENT